MTIIRIQAFVSGSPEAVYEHVTAYAATGRTNRRTLEERYGKLVARDGDVYTFKGDSEEAVSWSCAFQAPTQRVMRALDSKWADRFDWFEPSGNGTLWTIVWETKVTGLRALTQGLGYHLAGKRKMYAQVVEPVIRHFQQESGGQT